MAEQFPRLSAATLAAANQVGAWLAQDDLATLPALPQVDVVVLAGNAVIPTIDAACRLAAAQAVPLLISGGVGHSTGYLYEAVRQDPRYRTLPVDGRPEAVAALACKGLEYMDIAKKAKLPRGAGLAAYLTRPVLELAARQPQLVAAGALEVPEFIRRKNLLWQSLTGRF